VLDAGASHPHRDLQKEINMAELHRYGQASAQGRAGTQTIDEGLRAFMLGVYNYLALGLLVTGIVAYFTFNMIATTDPALAATSVRGAVALKHGLFLTPFGYSVLTSPLFLVIAFAPLALMVFLAFRAQKMSLVSAQAVYWLVTVLIGLSLSTIFLRYTHDSIARVFFITAASFGGLSLYGYTTKRDLSGMLTFLVMGAIGLILAMVVTAFFPSTSSPAIQFAISAIGVLVFAGFTAYDTQNIKEQYYVGDDGTVAGKKAVFGALNLYLDFINMFQFLLSLLGNRD
jgi:uncharacterized protein